MLKNIESFDALKRVIYIFLLPAVFVVTVVMFVLQIIHQDFTFGFYANSAFIEAFIISWIFVYRNKPLQIVEYYILVLVIIVHLGSITIEIVTNVGVDEATTLIAFILRTPLIIMFIFLVLRKWQALGVSISLLVFSMLPVFLLYTELNGYFVNSLIEFYISTAVYIIMVFFMNELFRMHGEMKAMRRMLFLDSLTQIGNRYQIDEWMKTFIGEAEEDGNFSLLFFDVDRFKNVNDRFGHKVGDDVLKETVRIVQDEIRKDEFFGRWGGEEFIIFLQMPECQAYEVAERLRQTIEQHDFGEVGRVTVSFGVTSYVQGDSAEMILMRADKLLYASKENGRNRVTGKMMPRHDD